MILIPELKSEQTHFLRDYQMLVNNEERQRIEFLKDEQKANAVRELAIRKTEQNYHDRKKKSKAG